MKLKDQPLKPGKHNHQGEGGGRPLMYKTAEELEAKIHEYFTVGRNVRPVVVGPPNARRIENIAIPTITGLTLYLGFATKTSFYTLEKDERFEHVVKSARTRIEREYEELLLSGLGAGAIFGLKNFGWVDKTEIDHSGDGLKNVIMVQFGDGNGIRGRQGIHTQPAIH